MTRKYFEARVSDKPLSSMDDGMSEDAVIRLARKGFIAWNRQFGAMIVLNRMSDSEAVSAALEILDIEFRYHSNGGSIQFRGESICGSVPPLLRSDGWVNPDKLAWAALKSKIEMKICSQWNWDYCFTQPMSMARFKTSCEAIAHERRV